MVSAGRKNTILNLLDAPVYESVQSTDNDKAAVVAFASHFIGDYVVCPWPFRTYPASVYYYTDKDSDFSNLTNWTVGEGEAPVISNGQYFTFDLNGDYFYFLSKDSWIKAKTTIFRDFIHKIRLAEGKIRKFVSSELDGKFDVWFRTRDGYDSIDCLTLTWRNVPENFDFSNENFSILNVTYKYPLLNISQFSADVISKYFIDLLRSDIDIYIKKILRDVQSSMPFYEFVEQFKSAFMLDIDELSDGMQPYSFHIDYTKFHYQINVEYQLKGEFDEGEAYLIVEQFYSVLNRLKIRYRVKYTVQMSIRFLARKGYYLCYYSEPNDSFIYEPLVKE